MSIPNGTEPIRLSTCYDGPIRTSDGMLELHAYVIADIQNNRVVLGRADIRVKDWDVAKALITGLINAVQQQSSNILLPR